MADYIERMKKQMFFFFFFLEKNSKSTQIPQILKRADKTATQRRWFQLLRFTTSNFFIEFFLPFLFWRIDSKHVWHVLLLHSSSNSSTNFVTSLPSIIIGNKLMHLPTSIALAFWCRIYRRRLEGNRII